MFSVNNFDKFFFSLSGIPQKALVVLSGGAVVAVALTIIKGLKEHNACEKIKSRIEIAKTNANGSQLAELQSTLRTQETEISDKKFQLSVLKKQNNVGLFGIEELLGKKMSLIREDSDNEPVTKPIKKTTQNKIAALYSLIMGEKQKALSDKLFLLETRNREIKEMEIQIETNKNTIQKYNAEILSLLPNEFFEVYNAFIQQNLERFTYQFFGHVRKNASPTFLFFDYKLDSYSQKPTDTLKMRVVENNSRFDLSTNELKTIHLKDGSKIKVTA